MRSAPTIKYRINVARVANLPNPSRLGKDLTKSSSRIDPSSIVHESSEGK
jgi:hypothetical protein